MRKLIKLIIEMTDSNTLNENGNVVANTPYEENVPTQEVKTKENDSNENVENKDENKTSSNTVATDNNANSSTESKSNETVEETLPEDPKDDDMKLLYLDKDFVYECMAVPTHSKKEYRMVTFIMLWARKNNITYEFDDFGNIYLTKGELAEGEFYPCVTSHLDTVQDKQDPYIYAGVPLDIKTERTKDGDHKISVDSNGGASIGIGADDKGGVCICLTMFNYVDKLKACFFLDEETGCHGSDNLDKEWFENVGYVIGFDSPELYRAAWACSGVKLFSYDFYTKHMKDVCDRWGLTKGCFFSEPYTDVKNIREKTNIICMNFGNGGYNPHSPTEYTIIEDMDNACGMGIDLVDNIGCTQHKLKSTNSWTSRTNNTYKRNADGTYKCITTDDTELLRDLGDNCRRSNYGFSSQTAHTTNTTTTTTTKKEDELKFETVKYIVNRYDSYILGIKEDVLEAVKTLCEKSKVEFGEFEKVINDKFSNEIKF